MRVYRIETDTEEGVYRYEPARVHAADRFNPQRQPMPGEYLLGQGCEHGGADHRWHECRRFAFPTLTALREWFDLDARRGLREVPKVAVSVYDAPDETVRADGYQATFMRCRATLRERVPVPA